MIKRLYNLLESVACHSHTKKAGVGLWNLTQKILKKISSISVKTVGHSARYVAETIEAKDTLQNIRNRQNHEQMLRYVF